MVESTSSPASPASSSFVGNARAAYEALQPERDNFRRMGEEASRLTIPSLFPPQGSISGTELYQPYQSLGSRGVNNLASKLLLAVLPPSFSFFRLTDNTPNISELDAEATSLKKAVDEVLAQKVEPLVLRYVNAPKVRSPMFESLKHLVVTGNALVFFGLKLDDPVKVYPLDRYVVRRDPQGNVLEVVTRESISLSTLPPDIQSLLREAPTSSDPTYTGNQSDPKVVDLFTHVVRREKSYEYYQQVGNIVLPKSQGTCPLDACPWLALRLITVDGESYGRGWVETCIGDLRAFDKLSQNMLDAAAIASLVKFAVNPAGVTRFAQVKDAPNGGSFPGRAEDVVPIQAVNMPNLTFVSQFMQSIHDRLEHVFLLNSAVQRNAERVTAEEIRFVANELETALGGVYSALSVELQQPIVRLFLARLKASGALKGLRTDLVNVLITTGVDALGRTQELQRHMTAAQLATQTIGPEQFVQHINTLEWLKAIFVSMGLPTEKLVKTQEQIDEERQALQQQQAQNEIIKGATPEVTKGIVGQMTGQNAQTSQ